ncbi:MAG: YqjK family protein, partial [Propionivibrio sp.]
AADSLAAVDRLLARARGAKDYVAQHASVTALAIIALIVVRPKRAWRWAKRGFFAWQTWRTLSQRLHWFAGRPVR